MHLLRKGLAFMINRKAAMALATWRGMHGPDADTMGRGARHFMNRQLSKGWNGWHQLWAEKRRKLDSMQRSLKHMVNRKLSAGWNAWVEMRALRLEFMQLLRKGLSFMMNRQLSSHQGSSVRSQTAVTYFPPSHVTLT